MSYCGSKLGLTAGPSCSSAQAHPAGGSCSIPCPKHCQGEMATAALLLHVQGQRSPHEAKHVDLGLLITFHPLWGAADVFPPWLGSCHSLRVRGRSSSTSPASSLPATGESHFISSPRSIKDHILQCLLAPLHPSVLKVPPLPTPPHHSKRPPVPSELFRRDLGNPFDTNSILRYK